MCQVVVSPPPQSTDRQQQHCLSKFLREACHWGCCTHFPSFNVTEVCKLRYVYVLALKVYNWSKLWGKSEGLCGHWLQERIFESKNSRLNEPTCSKHKLWLDVCRAIPHLQMIGLLLSKVHQIGFFLLFLLYHLHVSHCLLHRRCWCATWEWNGKLTAACRGRQVITVPVNEGSLLYEIVNFS